MLYIVPSFVKLSRMVSKLWSKVIGNNSAKNVGRATVVKVVISGKYKNLNKITKI